ncbi:hypothetical protein ABTM81_20200, partial [Acinetobacter baumannii]
TLHWSDGTSSDRYAELLVPVRKHPSDLTGRRCIAGTLVTTSISRKVPTSAYRWASDSPQFQNGEPIKRP